MRPEDRDLALLWDMRKFALERVLEALGEAACRVSPESQAQHEPIDWRAIVGQRNVLAHDYGKINHRRLYDTTRQIIPSPLAERDRILGEP